MANKSNTDNLNNQRDAYKDQVGLSARLLAQVKELNVGGEVGLKITKDLNDALKDKITSSDAIEALDKSIQSLLIEQAITHSDINQEMLDSLDASKKMLEKEKERDGIQQDMKKSLSGIKDDLLGSLGPAGALANQLMSATKAMMPMIILAVIVKYLIDAVNRGVELNKTMGLSAKNAAVFEGNLQLARLSIDGMKHGMDALTNSAMEIVKQTGKININPDFITNATEVSALLGDDTIGVSLTRSLEAAGHNSGELTDKIKEIANSLGQDAGPAMEMLAANQGILSRLTDEEVLARAKSGLMIKKMGLDVKRMNELAGEGLDIEKSMRAEMKLRVMSGKEISFNAIRQAKLSGDAEALAKATRDVILKLGPEYEKNANYQRMITDSTGLTNDEIQNVLNSKSENEKLDKNLLKIMKEQNFETKEQAQEHLTKKDNTKSLMAMMVKYKFLILGAGAALAVLFGLGKVGTLGAMGEGIASFMTKLGSPKVLMGAVAMILVASSVLVLGLALKQFMGIEWGDMAKAAVAILVLTGMMFGLGALIAGPGALIFGAGVIGFIALGAALIVLGIGLNSIGAGISSISGGLTSIIPTLTTLFDNISVEKLTLLELLGTALMGVATGLALIGSIGLPGLVALSGLAGITMVLAPALMEIGNLIGGMISGDSDDGGNSESNALLNELKGLRGDIQSQPILISVDGKVVSRISRLQAQQGSGRAPFQT